MQERGSFLRTRQIARQQLEEKRMFPGYHASLFPATRVNASDSSTISPQPRLPSSFEHARPDLWMLADILISVL